MSIVEPYIELAQKIHRQISIPAVHRIYLPERNNSDEFRDEFGLLFLEDGTAAPFYTSLPGTLTALQALIPESCETQYNTLYFITLFSDEQLANKAIALGAFNAMSQHLMKRAGLLPQVTQIANKNMGSGKPQPGEQVGMIGYFCPLIDKLLSRGVKVLVIEQIPERIDAKPGLHFSQKPADLAQCRIVLCTAATLINDSLDDILSHCPNAETFSIIGPSGSGLPDALFAKGVHSVGGVYFADSQQLSEKLIHQSSWGDAGEKYQLTPNNYPGFQALLDKISS
jgi:uncharacterized protein (DUF4213/DUF364 family)